MMVESKRSRSSEKRSSRIAYLISSDGVAAHRKGSQSVSVVTDLAATQHENTGPTLVKKVSNARIAVGMVT